MGAVELGRTPVQTETGHRPRELETVEDAEGDDPDRPHTSRLGCIRLPAGVRRAGNDRRRPT